MKTFKAIIALIAISFFITVYPGSEKALATEPEICTWCKVSSNPLENTGYCRAAATGDICYDDSPGPACSENGSKKGPCDS